MAALPKRVLAYLRLPNSSEIRMAKFGECILDSFSNASKRDGVKICCQLADEKLILSSSLDDDSSAVRSLFQFYASIIGSINKLQSESIYFEVFSLQKV
jgi:hypothetical protein